MIRKTLIAVVAVAVFGGVQQTTTAHAAAWRTEGSSAANGSYAYVSAYSDLLENVQKFRVRTSGSHAKTTVHWSVGCYPSYWAYGMNHRSGTYVAGSGIVYHQLRFRPAVGTSARLTPGLSPAKARSGSLCSRSARRNAGRAPASAGADHPALTSHDQNTQHVRGGQR